MSASQPSVLLIGSSIFEQWTQLPRQLPDWSVYNQAIGGTTAEEWIHTAAGVIARHPADVLCIYVGSNDVSHGATAEQLTTRLRDLLAVVRSARAGQPTVYTSIIRAPEKRHAWDIVDAGNALVRAEANAHDDLWYLDVNDVFFQPGGEPNEELYVADQVHLRPAAYRAMADRLASLLETIYKNRSS